jgi:hypothetical protein
VANNPAIFNGAIAGFVAGYTDARFVTQRDASIYSDMLEAATVFATLVDGMIATDPSLTQTQATALSELVAGAFSERYQVEGPDVDLVKVAQGVVTLYTGESASFIPEPPFGGSVWKEVGGIISPIDTATPSLAGSDCTVDTSSDNFAWGDSTAVDVGAFAGALGTATAIYAVAFADSTANGEYSFAAAGGNVESGANAVALAGGTSTSENDFSVSSGTASGGFSCGLAGGLAQAAYSLAANQSSVAQGPESTAFAGGTTVYQFDFASGLGSIAQSLSSGAATALSGASALNDFAFAAGDASVASGVNAAALAAGLALGNGSFAAVGGSDGGFTSCGIIGPYDAGFDSVYAIGDSDGAFVATNFDGAGGVEITPAAGGILSVGATAHQTTVGAAGGASIPPATPLGYLLVTIPGIGPVAIRYDNPV